MRYKNSTAIHIGLWSVMQLTALIFAAATGCILISMCTMLVYGEQHGLHLLINLFQQDSLYIARNHLHCLQDLQRQLSPVKVLNNLMANVNSNFQKAAFNVLSPFICVVLLSIKLFLLRFYLLLHDFMLFFILATAALIDGLAQRYVRKKSAGRESVFIYHNLKPFITLNLAVVIIVQLDLPFPVQTTQSVVTGIILISAFVLQIITKRFKKYL